MANTTAGTDLTKAQSASDGQLLATVADVADGSELRFAELVRRHGPMVLAACRRQLGNRADAEDAAQAVFLLLWQQARRLRNRTCVAGWLHHAARNICRNALRARTVRNEHERKAAGTMADATEDQQQWDRIKDLLDDELDHLPEKYRLPIVLFHLEGRSLEEIAVLLQMKESTVGTRLIRGRERLRKRLQRRGIALSAAGLGTLLSQNAVHAGLPLFFAEKTARAASLVAAGRLTTGELISTHAVALSKGAMQMQTMAKVKSVAAVVFLAIAVGGIGMVIAQEQARTQPSKDHSEDKRAAKATVLPQVPGKLDPVLKLRHTDSRGTPRPATLSFSPKGLLLTASVDGKVRLWDLATGKEQSSFLTDEGDHDVPAIYPVVFSPDGQMIASGGGRINLRSGKRNRRFDDIDEVTYSLAFSPDGKTLASCEGQAMINLWDVATGKVHTRIKVDHDPQCVHWTGDGRLLVVCDGATLRDALSGKVLRRVKWDVINQGSPFSPHGEAFAQQIRKEISSEVAKSTFLIRNTKTGRNLCRLDGHVGKRDNAHVSVAISADGKYVASANGQGRVLVWRIDADGPAQQPEPPPNAPADNKVPADEKPRERVKTTEKNGLSVSLVAVKQTFTEGEALRFRATFKNVSNKDFRLYDPLWYRDWEMTIDDGPWLVSSLVKGIRQPAVLLLKAGKELAVDIKIDDKLEYRWIGAQFRPVPPRAHLKPGKYKLQAAIRFIKNDTNGAPFWTGTVKTPPAAFEIVADPIPARLRQVEWGKETNGLVAKFRAVKTVVKPGDPMAFEILVKNVSKKEITLAALNGRLAHYQWRFHFGDWTWSSPGPSLKGMRLKPGDTESVRCLVATTRDSLTAEQKSLFYAGPFRNVKTEEKSTRLPEGVYRVRAELPRGFDPSLETNVIGVRIALAQPLSAEVDRTWKDAGARVGWVWVDRSGRIHFNTAKKEPGGQIPGFQFIKWRNGVLSKLPDPGLPFGLDLLRSKITDAGLKELAGLKSLQMLNLGVTQVTDAGLKDLAALKSLQALNLSGTKVTDAGLKELGGLKSLQSLNLRGIQVTDAGLKELARLKNLQTLNLFNTKVTNAGLKELAGLKSLQSLDLGYTQVTDAGLKELAGLKNLQTLNLYKTQVTDAGLKELAELKSLQSLSLFNSKVTDAGLKELAGLKSLQSLYIGGTQMTDAGLKELARLKNLQTLNLFNTKVTGASLKDLAGLKSLQTLSLWNAPVTDAALKGLAGLKSLQTLYLGGTKVTDAGLKEVAGLKSLQSLDLYNTQVTDAGLKELAGLKSLRDLHLQSTLVTKAGIAELRKALPDCRIR